MVSSGSATFQIGLEVSNQVEVKEAEKAKVIQDLKKEMDPLLEKKVDFRWCNQEISEAHGEYSQKINSLFEHYQNKSQGLEEKIYPDIFEILQGFAKLAPSLKDLNFKTSNNLLDTYKNLIAVIDVILNENESLTDSLDSLKKVFFSFCQTLLKECPTVVVLKALTNSFALINCFNDEKKIAEYRVLKNSGMKNTADVKDDAQSPSFYYRQYKSTPRGEAEKRLILACAVILSCSKWEEMEECREYISQSSSLMAKEIVSGTVVVPYPLLFIYESCERWRNENSPQKKDFCKLWDRVYESNFLYFSVSVFLDLYCDAAANDEPMKEQKLEDEIIEFLRIDTIVSLQNAINRLGEYKNEQDPLKARYFTAAQEAMRRYQHQIKSASLSKLKQLFNSVDKDKYKEALEKSIKSSQNNDEHKQAPKELIKPSQLPDPLLDILKLFADRMEEVRDYPNVFLSYGEMADILNGFDFNLSLLISKESLFFKAIKGLHDQLEWRIQIKSLPEHKGGVREEKGGVIEEKKSDITSSINRMALCFQTGAQSSGDDLKALSDYARNLKYSELDRVGAATVALSLIADTEEELPSLKKQHFPSLAKHVEVLTHYAQGRRAQDFDYTRRLKEIDKAFGEFKPVFPVARIIARLAFIETLSHMGNEQKRQQRASSITISLLSTLAEVKTMKELQNTGIVKWLYLQIDMLSCRMHEKLQSWKKHRPDPYYLEFGKYRRGECSGGSGLQRAALLAYCVRVSPSASESNKTICRQYLLDLVNARNLRKLSSQQSALVEILRKLQHDRHIGPDPEVAIYVYNKIVQAGGISAFRRAVAHPEFKSFMDGQYSQESEREKLEEKKEQPSSENSVNGNGESKRSTAVRNGTQASLSVVGVTNTREFSGASLQGPGSEVKLDLTC